MPVRKVRAPPEKMPGNNRADSGKRVYARAVFRQIVSQKINRLETGKGAKARQELTAQAATSAAG